ncbi:MAG: DUF4332 domain-containing protein [Anaerolineales bacterium]|nr:DUF4332 domain-containing protein [Anaerolineales bacterium]
MFRKFQFRLMFVIGFGLMLWFLTRPRKETTPTPEPKEITIPHRPGSTTSAPAKKRQGQRPSAITKPKTTSPAAGAPQPDDDLTRLDGIGPRIASLLKTAGITSYARLADTPIDKLQQILGAASLRLAKPETWPAQARLAAAGDWQGWKELVLKSKSSPR